MKINKQMKTTTLIFSLLLTTVIISCKKHEGPGGNSQITGQVIGVKYSTSQPRAEVTEITCFNNSDPSQTNSPLYNDGYFLLNTPNGAGYYVYFGTSPSINGRTGIPINLNNGASSLTVATAIKNAVTSVAGADYTATLHAGSSNIVVITNNVLGEVPDAQDGIVKSKVQVDIAVQGKSLTPVSNEAPYPLEKVGVYIVYGDNGIYTKKFETDANGNYWFTGLTKGSYKLYAYTTDPLTGFDTPLERNVTISKKWENVVVETMTILD